MELWIATSNSGKLKEIRNILVSHPLEIHSQNELGYYSPPPESGDSFLANARLKTKSLAAVKPGVWVFGEDSGLEVEGLGNLPGIHSARYAGEKARDSENTAKVLKMLQLRNPSLRDAQFRCLGVAISPKGEELVFEGVLKGRISEKVRGTVGFGYDPIFIPEGKQQTLAELGEGEKNKISHRAQVLRHLLEKIIL